jgi:hypothetical protein
MKVDGYWLIETSGATQLLETIHSRDRRSLVVISEVDGFGYRVKTFALEKDEFGLEPIWMEIDSPSIIDDLAIAKRIATELMSAVNGSI